MPLHDVSYVAPLIDDWNDKTVNSKESHLKSQVNSFVKAKPQKKFLTHP